MAAVLPSPLPPLWRLFAGWLIAPLVLPLLLVLAAAVIRSGMNWIEIAPRMALIYWLPVLGISALLYAASRRRWAVSWFVCVLGGFLTFELWLAGVLVFDAPSRTDLELAGILGGVAGIVGAITGMTFWLLTHAGQKLAGPPPEEVF